MKKEFEHYATGEIITLDVTQSGAQLGDRFRLLNEQNGKLYLEGTSWFLRR